MLRPDDRGEVSARQIGEVIRRARHLRGWTQGELAGRLGYHQSKVSRMERAGTQDGHVLRAVAVALDIPLQALGLAPVVSSDSEIQDMHRRSFLAAGVSALTLPAPGTGRAVGAAAELVRALMPGWTATQTQAVHYAGLEPRVLAARALFCTARYRELDATLPALIIDLRAASADGRDDVRLSRMLATVYQLAASTLLKRGDVGSAWLAVGRAVAEGERSADPVTLASSVRLQGHALTREGHTGAAVAAIRHTADQLTGSYDHRSTDYLAALGLLLLRGVTAASRGGDRAAVKDFLNEAADVARYVQVDRPDSWANFSTTNLTLHSINAHVALGLSLIHI